MCVQIRNWCFGEEEERRQALSPRQQLTLAASEALSIRRHFLQGKRDTRFTRDRPELSVTASIGTQAGMQERHGIAPLRFWS